MAQNDGGLGERFFFFPWASSPFKPQFLSALLLSRPIHRPKSLSRRVSYDESILERLQAAAKV